MARSKHATMSKRTNSSERTYSMRLPLGKKQTNMHGDIHVAEEADTHALENAFYRENTFCLCLVW